MTKPDKPAPRVRPAPSEPAGRRLFRRRFFFGWIALTCVIVAYTALAGPLVPHVEGQYRWVAAVVPPVMILLTLTGVGWLALYVAGRPR